MGSIGLDLDSSFSWNQLENIDLTTLNKDIEDFTDATIEKISNKDGKIPVIGVYEKKTKSTYTPKEKVRDLRDYCIDLKKTFAEVLKERQDGKIDFGHCFVDEENLTEFKWIVPEEDKEQFKNADITFDFRDRVGKKKTLELKNGTFQLGTFTSEQYARINIAANRALANLNSQKTDKTKESSDEGSHPEITFKAGKQEDHRGIQDLAKPFIKANAKVLEQIKKDEKKAHERQIQKEAEEERKTHEETVKKLDEHSKQIREFNTEDDFRRDLKKEDIKRKVG